MTPVRQIGVFVSVAVASTSVLMLLATSGRIPVGMAVLSGVLLSFLAVYGLPSVGPDRAALAILAVGWLAGIRFLGVPGASPSWLLPWVVAATATLVLSAGGGERSAKAVLEGSRERPGATVGSVVAVSVVVLLVTALLGPFVASRAQSSTAPGAAADFGSLGQSGASLLASGSLDATSRPRLSDRVVMTVRSPVPGFWRGEVFDEWDGTRWTRSDAALERLRLDGTGGSVVTVDADDVAGREGELVRQRFELVSPASTVVFGMASVVRVETPVAVFQRPDGTLVSAGFGQGAVWTSESRRIPVTEDDLREATGEVPPEIVSQYASDTVISDRVAAAARRVTAGLTTTFDRVDALERFMGATTEYSTDAPLAPRGVDVVDHFLFESKFGWCEQIASALVVMARSLGIPARVATGFVPGERDTFTGTYTVREKHAHAWAEVWFPGVGWQTFDPTAFVPRGEVPPSLLERLRDNALVVGLGVLGVIALLAVARALRPMVRARGGRAHGWSGAALARMERLGRRAGRPRHPHETATAYGGVLAAHLDQPGLVAVGRTVDAGQYAATGPPPGDRQASDAHLVAARRAQRRRGRRR